MRAFIAAAILMAAPGCWLVTDTEPRDAEEKAIVEQLADPNIDPERARMLEDDLRRLREAEEQETLVDIQHNLVPTRGGGTADRKASGASGASVAPGCQPPGPLVGTWLAPEGGVRITYSPFGQFEHIGPAMGRLVGSYCVTGPGVVQITGDRGTGEERFTISADGRALTTTNALGQPITFTRAGGQ